MIFDQLRRRDFIVNFGGAAALTWPIGARAQQTPHVLRVGFVYPGSKTVIPSRIEAILSGLRVSGLAPPAQIELVVRTAEGDPAQITTLVTEVMATTVNAFIANGPAVLNAARSATRTIPIVAIDLETDPVASGAAATLARPGGNITGVFLDFPNFTAKWLEMLVETSSKLSRVAVLWDPATGPVQMESIKRAGGRDKATVGHHRGTAFVRFRGGLFGDKPTRR
jgi:putative tryptophan/tyrosine transport system substrate-binding protein